MICFASPPEIVWAAAHKAIFKRRNRNAESRSISSARRTNHEVIEGNVESVYGHCLMTLAIIELGRTKKLQKYKV